MWHRFGLTPRADGRPELYMVTVNAGFLGLPFVADIRGAKNAATDDGSSGRQRYGVWAAPAKVSPKVRDAWE